MYDFLRKPLWILSHVLVALLVVAMVALGFWQRSRWQEVSAEAERYDARIHGRAVDLDEVVPSSVRSVDRVPADAEYHRVVLRGRYDTAGEVEIRSRSLNGDPGAWVLTPLVLQDASVVPVVRGWIPLDLANAGPPFPRAAPPSGEVTVTGVVRLTQTRGLFGATDPPTGRLEDLARVDVARFARQVDARVVPVWVQLDGQDPPQASTTPEGEPLPTPVVVELRSASTNLSYMVQWWIFATIAGVGYVLVLRRLARQRAAGDVVPVDEPDDGAPVRADA